MKTTKLLARKTPLRQRKPMVKRSRPKMTPLRKGAKDTDCTIRIPCRCIDNPETTVRAHYRLGTGVGQKPNDMQAARACFVCHDIVDGRMEAPEFTYEEIRLMHAEGVFRTQQAVCMEQAA